MFAVPTALAACLSRSQRVRTATSGSPSTPAIISAASLQPGFVTEFSVPTASGQPRGITAGPDGNVWFTEQNGNKIGRITTAGVITEFSVPTASSQPRGITAGPDGNIWFTESNANKIGELTLPTGRALTATINQATTQVDPTNSSPIHFTAVFSAPVTGFSASGVTLSGTAHPSSDTVTGNGTTYDVAVSGMTSDGTVSVSLNAGAGHDSAGNTSSASTSADNSVTYDTTPPSVTINQAATQADPTNASPIHFTAVFSAPVTGFSASGVTLSGTANPSSDTVTGSGTTYDVAVSGMTGNGTLTAGINAHRQVKTPDFGSNF